MLSSMFNPCMYAIYVSMYLCGHVSRTLTPTITNMSGHRNWSDESVLLLAGRAASSRSRKHWQPLLTGGEYCAWQPGCVRKGRHLCLPVETINPLESALNKHKKINPSQAKTSQAKPNQVESSPVQTQTNRASIKVKLLTSQKAKR